MADDRRRFGRETHDDERLGLDEPTSYVDELVGRSVPQFVARRAVVADVATDRDRYRPGEPVAFTVEFRNRLPVPVSIRTPGPRPWVWTFDGLPEATDERRHVGAGPGTFDFAGGEAKRVTRRWDGLVRRDDEDRWVEPAPGEHELAVRVPLAEPPRPAAATTVEIR